MSKKVRTQKPKYKERKVKLIITNMMRGEMREKEKRRERNDKEREREDRDDEFNIKKEDITEDTVIPKGPKKNEILKEPTQEEYKKR